MKKVIGFLTAAALVMTSGIAVMAENNDLKVYVDNQQVEFVEQSPVIRDDRTLVPIRAVFEKAGAQVSWDQETQTATLKKDTYTVTIKLYESFLYKNGKPVSLDVPSIIENDRILIPVRAISEAMDFGVTWDGVHYSVLVSTDSKAYRANAGWKTGFRDIKDAGIYIKNDVNDLEYDLNGDGTPDKISFKKQTDDTAAAFSINGKDFSELIPKVYNNAKAIAVVDVMGADKYTEIAIIDGEDYNSAWFFRYNGIDLLPLKCNSTVYGDIPFLDKLFVDGVDNIISDFDGMCWLDLMVTPGIYTMTEKDIERYALGVDTVAGRDLFKTYNDNMVYNYKKTDSYQKGQYVSDEDQIEKHISVSELPDTFKLLDFYVDETDPSKFEFFIQYSDGTKAVIWTYMA